MPDRCLHHRPTTVRPMVVATTCPFAQATPEIADLGHGDDRPAPGRPKKKQKRNAVLYQVRVQQPSYRWSTLKSQARRRGLECDITLGVFTHITTQPCYYCGDTSSGHRGIDRLNNDHGYVAGNMVPACSLCNYMKSTLTEDQFVRQITRIGMFQLCKEHDGQNAD